MGDKLAKFYQDYNFNKDGKLYFGLYRGRILSIISSGNYLKASIAFNQPVDVEVGRTVSNKISEIKASNRILQRGITTKAGVELFFYQALDIQTQFFIVLDKVYDELEKLDLKSCDTCPLCGKNMSSDAPFLRLRGTMVMQAHNECIDYTLSLANEMEKKQFPDNKKTALKYFLSSVILMIAIACIFIGLSVAGAYQYIAIVSGWLFLIVNKIIMFRIKIPKVNKYLILNTIFATLLCIIVTFFGSMFDISVSSGIDITQVFKNIKEVFSLNNYENLKYLSTDLILSLTFVALNSFLDLKNAKETLNGTKKINKK